MDFEEERSAETRHRAESALVWLLHELRDAPISIIVLGGLVPKVLTHAVEKGSPGHLGTADVDVLLITHVDADADLSPVERALGKIDFEPDPDPDGWRWRGQVGVHGVKIEFLCDLPTVRENEIVLPHGCERLHAANLRGTGFVARDWEFQEISGTLRTGEVVSVRARFAGLQGYLLSKCVAVRHRGATKDYYDFAYVLIHNIAGGPEAAAGLLSNGTLSDALSGLRSTFLEVRERYRATNDLGPRDYASQMRIVDPNADEARLRADAVAGVQEFFKALGL